MVVDELKDLLYKLGAKVVKLDSRGYNVMSNCPFQKWLHSDGVDSKPSFGISVDSSHRYNCFACNIKGIGIYSLLSKLTRFDPQVKALLDEYNVSQNNVFRNEILAALDKFIVEVRTSIQRANFTEWSEEAIRDFLGKVPQYYVDRVGKGVSIEDVLSIARLFNLGYDIESKVLIIPIREQQGSIVSIVRRFLETGQYVNELGWSRGEFLYGEQFFNVECPNVYIVEGYFDVWRLYALGYTNVYAIMGNKISDRQAAKIAAFGRNTFVIPDKDKGGEELVVSARAKLIRLGVPLFTNQPLQSDPCYYTKDEVEKFIQGSFRLFE